MRSEHSDEDCRGEYTSHYDKGYATKRQREPSRACYDSPHAAIEGRNVGAIVNLADCKAESNRAASVDLVQQGPDSVLAILRRFGDQRPRNLDLFVKEEPIAKNDAALPSSTEGSPPACGGAHLRLPPHHDVRAADVDMKRLHATLAAAARERYCPWLLLPKSFTVRRIDSTIRHALH